MILSNRLIHQALDDRRLVIEPEPSPRFPAPGLECPYDTSAVNLRLGPEVAFFKERLGINIDLRRGRFADLFGPNSERRQIEPDQPFALAPGKLVLGQSLERVELPIQSSGASLAARVEGRSSYARCGLLVHFTAPTIHAGFRGTITLELINLGPIPILLYPQTAICQLIIEEVAGEPIRNESQFQDQRRPGGVHS